MHELCIFCIEDSHSDSRLILDQEGDVHGLNICHSEESSHCTLAGFQFILKSFQWSFNIPVVVYLEALFIETCSESVAAELAHVTIVLL